MYEWCKDRDGPPSRLQEKYERLLRRIPAKWREYRAREAMPSLSLCIRRIQMDAQERMILRMRPQQLKKSGLSYAQIARRLHLMRSDGTPNGERVRGLLKSRRLKSRRQQHPRIKLNAGFIRGNNPSHELSIYTGRNTALTLANRNNAARAARERERERERSGGEAIVDRAHPDTLTPKQAARYVGISEGALRLWRGQGKGPVFFRCGEKLVRYRRIDLDSSIQERLSTPAVIESR